MGNQPLVIVFTYACYFFSTLNSTAIMQTLLFPKSHLISVYYPLTGFVSFLRSSSRWLPIFVFFLLLLFQKQRSIISPLLYCACIPWLQSLQIRLVRLCCSKYRIFLKLQLFGVLLPPLVRGGKLLHVNVPEGWHLFNYFVIYLSAAM